MGSLHPVVAKGLKLMEWFAVPDWVLGRYRLEELVLLLLLLVQGFEGLQMLMMVELPCGELGNLAFASVGHTTHRVLLIPSPLTAGHSPQPVPTTPTPLGEAHRQHVGSPVSVGLAAPLAGDFQIEIAEADTGLPLPLLGVGYLGVAALVALDMLSSRLIQLLLENRESRSTMGVASVIGDLFRLGKSVNE
eukprot:5754352-Amphidinium_carterae.1